MKHVFILNPAAGNGKIARKLHPLIIDAVKNNDLSYEIHRTVSLGDARNYTRNKCIEAGKESIRFYACGGDGTINEVLNGLIYAPNAELAIIPSGTGNDFVRNFDDPKRFLDIEAQIHGETIKTDALMYEFLDLTDEEKKSYEEQNKSISGYALNMFNIGFDAQAVAKAAYYKTKPFINGTMAYIAGVLNVLIELKAVEIQIIPNEGEVIRGDFTLMGIANGRFSGGGFDGTPQAKIDDGLMDISLVKKVTRRFFLSFVKRYHDGKHTKDPALKEIYSHFRSNSVTIKPAEKVVLAIDGETVEVGNVRFGLREKAVRIVIPK